MLPPNPPPSRAFTSPTSSLSSQLPSSTLSHINTSSSSVLSQTFLFLFLSSICCLTLLSSSHPRGHWVLYILLPIYLLKSVPSFVFLVPLNFSFSFSLTWSRVMCHLDVILLPPKLPFEWRSNSLTYYSRPFIHFSLPSPQTYFSAGPFIL